jgi:hypothetical protein
MRRGSRARSLTAAATLAGAVLVGLAGPGGVAAQAVPPRAVRAVGPAAESAPQAPAALAWHRLHLLNSWKSAATSMTPSGTPSYGIRDGVVYLTGKIRKPAAGSSTFARLPAGYRPAHALWIQVLTGADDVPGTLRIEPDGVMSAYNGDALTSTSLAMVSFPTRVVKTHSLALVSGWGSGQGAYNSGRPAYSISHGIVYISGSLIASSGTPPTVAATLPAFARPKHTIYLTVYTFDGASGSLVITPGGLLEAYGSSRASYTSLAGISYPVASTRWHALRLLADWTVAAPLLDAGHPSYAVINGIVYLSGGAQQPSPAGALLCQMPKAARSKHALSALVYAGDGQSGSATSYSSLLVVSSEPTSISQQFISLAGMSYPVGT